MELEPIPDVPAMLMKGRDSWICVADLHIGIEAQLRRSGFNIPSQTEKMLKSLLGLRAHGDRLVLLGDLKHKIPGISYSEDRDIPPFIDALLGEFKDIVIVAGNHDGGLGAILPNGVRSFPGHGTLIEDVGVCHGHVWPSSEAMSGSRLVIGHVHPSVLLKDSIGSKSNEKCWARVKLDGKIVRERYKSCPHELVIVPAFNPLLTGTPVNGKRGMYLGPIFRNKLVDHASLKVYLLDGSDLGHVPEA